MGAATAWGVMTSTAVGAVLLTGTVTPASTRTAPAFGLRNSAGNAGSTSRTVAV